MKDKKNAELDKWRSKVSEAKTKLKDTREKMNERERVYKGEQYLLPVTDSQREAYGKGDVKAPHVFNIVAENIESEIDVNIPEPKVTAIRREDEPLAKLIEDYCRSERDRLQFEEMNDLQERIVPVQAGSYWQIGWDNAKRTHTTIGEVFAEVLHPKMVIPQPGVYTSVEDMSFIAIEVPKTKDDIKRRYGIDVSHIEEEEPDVKSSGSGELSVDMVTQVIVYYRNEEGGIGRYSYVSDIELENIKDWNARQRRRCAKCGAPEESAAAPMNLPTLDGTYPDDIPEGVEIPDDGTYTKAKAKKPRKDECPYCGGRKWEYMPDEYRTLPRDYKTQGTGKILPASETITDEYGNVQVQQAMYPYYRPNVYPIVLQRNISQFGELLGESDVDKIFDQQNTMNHINKAIIDRIFGAGTIISLPPDVEIETDEQNGRVIRPEDPAAMSLIKTFEFTGDLSTHLAYKSILYEEPRQVLGITDSLQGRRDSTATSAVAKEFAANQSAGRLESKRRMKNAAYARIYELMFKTALANMDEPRPIRQRENGKIEYKMFDPMDFYEQDDAGEWYVNDRFLFSTDTAAPLASNRDAMWREVTQQYAQGAYGDPTQNDTRLLYWSMMEELHYPLAARAKKHIEEIIEQQKAVVRAQMEAANDLPDGAPMPPAGGFNGGGQIL